MADQRRPPPGSRDDRTPGGGALDRGPSEEYAEAVEAIVRRGSGGAGSRMLEARGGDRSLLLVLVLAVTFIGVMVWNAFTVWSPREPADPAVAEATARLSVFVAAREVEAFRQREGRLPETLDEVGLGGMGLRYRITGDGYEIDGDVAGQAVRFTSDGDPAQLLRSLPLSLETTEDEV